MGVAIDPTTLVAFLLVSTRCAAWLFIAPPFQGAVPAKVRGGLALAIGLLLTPEVSRNAHLPVDDTGKLIAAMLYQVGIGLALGFVVFVIFQAVSAAGSMIDMFAGLTSAQVFDPMSKAAAGPFSRYYQLIATAVLFITGGHLLLLGGLARSFDAAPIGGLHMERLGRLLTADVGNFLVAALQIGAPVLGALFVTELLIGLASRAAPQLNVMVLGFGIKGLVTLMLTSVALPLLVGTLPSLVSSSLSGMWALVR